MNEYDVSLITENGVFDNNSFTNLKHARQWASGRQMHKASCGNWKKYTVDIMKNGKDFMNYKTF